MALEEIIVSYFDRIAERCADRMVAKLAPAVAAILAERGTMPAGEYLTVVPGQTPPGPRRPQQPPQASDRPIPGGDMRGAPVHDDKQVTDPPPVAPPAPPGDARRAIPNQNL
jgi:hypothetical protein